MGIDDDMQHWLRFAESVEGPSQVTAKEVEELIPETKEFMQWLQSQI